FGIPCIKRFCTRAFQKHAGCDCIKVWENGKSRHMESGREKAPRNWRRILRGDEIKHGRHCIFSRRERTLYVGMPTGKRSDTFKRGPNSCKPYLRPWTAP